MPTNPRPPGLIQRYREELQARHYAQRTVATYEQWLRRFLRFHHRRHPREMCSEEVNALAGGGGAGENGKAAAGGDDH